MAIWQKLADANPAGARYQSDLAAGHERIGLLLLMWMGKPEEALTASRKALAIQQKLADEGPPSSPTSLAWPASITTSAGVS